MSRAKTKRIPLSKCKRGRTYKIYCRNLKFGVFNGKDGFVGIRTKFGSRYLDSENHWDAENFATVRGIIDLGIDLPKDIIPNEYLGTYDSKSGRNLVYDQEEKNYRFVDTGELAPKYPKIMQTMRGNLKLFEFLEDIEKKVPWNFKDFDGA